MGSPTIRFHGRPRFAHVVIGVLAASIAVGSVAAAPADAVKPNIRWIACDGSLPFRNGWEARDAAVSGPLRCQSLPRLWRYLTASSACNPPPVPGSCRVLGFRCRNRTDRRADPGIATRCTKGSRVAEFLRVSSIE